jgi:hypothetical protein
MIIFFEWFFEKDEVLRRMLKPSMIAGALFEFYGEVVLVFCLFVVITALAT